MQPKLLSAGRRNTVHDMPAKKAGYLHDLFNFRKAALSALRENLSRVKQNSSNQNTPSTESLKLRATQVVACLEKYGVAVVDNFLGDKLSRQIQAEVQGMELNMKPGQTLTSQSGSHDHRSDSICWVQGTEPQCRHLRKLFYCVDTLIRYSDRKLEECNIRGRTQAMVARYPPRSENGYVAHVDNPFQDGRRLTCIYYLNNDWDAKADGGLLKVYPTLTNQVATIEPLLDRLVVFWSDKRNPHEVQPSYRPRYSVTLWYFDAEEREQAIQRLRLKRSLADSAPHSHHPTVPYNAGATPHISMDNVGSPDSLSDEEPPSKIRVRQGYGN